MIVMTSLAANSDVILSDKKFATINAVINKKVIQYLIIRYQDQTRMS